MDRKTVKKKQYEEIERAAVPSSARESFYRKPYKNLDAAVYLKGVGARIGQDNIHKAREPSVTARQ